jgi:hypothetical protein
MPTPFGKELNVGKFSIGWSEMSLIYSAASYAYQLW